MENSDQFCIDKFICCICLDETESDIIILDCCHQKIHKKCFIDWILFRGLGFNCPICRKNITSLKEIITLNDIFDNISLDIPINKTKIENANSIIHQHWSITEGTRIINFSIQTYENDTTSADPEAIFLQQTKRICNKIIGLLITILILGYFIFVIEKGTIKS